MNHNIFHHCRFDLWGIFICRCPSGEFSCCTQALPLGQVVDLNDCAITALAAGQTENGALALPMENGAVRFLAAEGLPDGANAEIAICLLMCASDAAAAGQRDVATRLTLRARDLVGEPAAIALLELIRGTEAGE